MYLDSVSVRALDANANGLQCSPCLWRRTPPSPYAEVSALTVMSLSTSHKASTLGEVISSFTFWKALSCAGVHTQAFFGLRSSRKGCDRSVILGENLFSWFIISMNLLNSVRDEGGAIFWIASVFRRSGETLR